MQALLFVPVVLSLLVLAAHFFRYGVMPAVVIVLALLPLLLLRRPWVARVVQVALVLGVLEWIRTSIVLVQARIDFGGPWLRLVIILGAVVLITAASALLFQSRPLRRIYGLTNNERLE